MTLDEFIVKLTITKRTDGAWEIASNRIRFSGPTFFLCPIEYLGGRYSREDGDLGLSVKDRDEIIKAADLMTGFNTPMTNYDKQLRRRLLYAVGLDEL